MNALMRSRLVVVTYIVLDQVFQLPLVQYQHMIQALSFHTSNKAFTDGDRLRSLKGCLHLLDA
jgi:hypothetical protein